MSIQHNFETLAMIGFTQALAGKKDEAFQIIKELNSQTDYASLHAIKIARIYLAMGEKEVAYKFLDEAIKRHDIDLIALPSDPRWTSIRSEKRFKELIRRVGIPS